jgi:hypothetical protein
VQHAARQRRAWLERSFDEEGHRCCTEEAAWSARPLKADPAKVGPWSTLLEQSTSGAVPVRVPMFVAPGLADDLVKPATTEQYATHLCDTGEQVHFRTYERTSHGLIADLAMPQVLETFAKALDRSAPTVTCPPS